MYGNIGPDKDLNRLLSRYFRRFSGESPQKRWGGRISYPEPFRPQSSGRAPKKTEKEERKFNGGRVQKKIRRADLSFIARVR